MKTSMNQVERIHMKSKKSVTLYLDSYLIEEMKDRNYNISLLCNEALKTMFSEHTNDIEYAAKLMSINELLEEHRKVVLQKQAEYNSAVEAFNKTVQRKNDFENEYAEAQRMAKMAKMLKDLNKYIISFNYDIEQVLEVCGEMVEKIIEISPQFNLDTHIVRLKRVML